MFWIFAQQGSRNGMQRPGTNYSIRVAANRHCQLQSSPKDLKIWNGLSSDIYLINFTLIFRVG